MGGQQASDIVSCIQGMMDGFNAPGNDGEDPALCTTIFQTQSFGCGCLTFSDDDLASDLGVLSINSRDAQPSYSTLR